jgi:hypothetical protein
VPTLHFIVPVELDYWTVTEWETTQHTYKPLTLYHRRAVRRMFLHANICTMLGSNPWPLAQYASIRTSTLNRSSNCLSDSDWLRVEKDTIETYIPLTLSFPLGLNELHCSLSIGGIPLLILATQEIRCVGKRGGISPVKKKYHSRFVPKSSALSYNY